MRDVTRWLGPVYPFTAIVGQDKVKTALILNAIDPTIGGVLISGPKGSGKSLLVKAFSQVLPDIEYVAGCPFRCSPVDPTKMCPSCLARLEAGEELPVARAPMRVVQAPLSVTDDMLLGSVALEEALEGERSVRPGLLAEANQNILYIDEVNLLPDHITDSILDAAASGWNTVEREGVSFQHPSNFALVGTMNPEEGELRPQILDRFGIYAETRNIEDPTLRALILRRNEEFIADPAAFISKHRGDLEELRARIAAARRLLPRVKAPEEAYHMVADVCSKLRVDGFRPDIVAIKSAKALAALHGRGEVAEEDVTLAVELALGHRTRRSGLAPPPSPSEIRKALRKARRRRLGEGIGVPGIRGGLRPLEGFIDHLQRENLGGLLVDTLLFGLLTACITYIIEAVRSALSPHPMTALVLLLEGVVGGALSLLITRLSWRRLQGEERLGRLDLSKITVEAKGRFTYREGGIGRGRGAGFATVRYGEEDATTPEYGLKILEPLEGLRRRVSARPSGRGRPSRGEGYRGGRRTRGISSSSRGMYAWYRVPRGKPTDIALGPTIRAAALRGSQGAGRTPRVVIKPEDIRVKVREYHAPFSIILLVDMSMSMIESMGNLIEAVYSLHGRVYRRRDRVGLIVFKGSRAFTVQHPTTNLDLIVENLKKVGASDFTPMAAGLLQALKVLKQERRRNRDAVQNLIVISDGIVNVPLDTPLSPLTRRRYTSEAQADALDVARLIAKEGIRVYVINTDHDSEEAEAFPMMAEDWRLKLTPTQFLIELARVSGGAYRGLRPEEAPSP